MSLATPLNGLTVLEIGHSVAAPFAGLVLTQLGAEVIKVEAVEGDPARGWGPPFVGSHSVLFDTLNGGKQSAVVDLRDAGQREVLRAFIQSRCDIVLQNLRPGVVERFHLAASDLRAAKPALIHCSISAFGAEGPLRDAPGYDPLMQAFAGMMSVTGEAGAAPVRIGPSIIDIGAGLWAVIGILAALADERGPRGATIHTSLYETALVWMSGYLATFMASGQEPERHGSGAPQIVPYQVFETADGPLMVAAGNDRLFARLCDVLGLADVAGDPRFGANAMRVANREALVAVLAKRFRTRDRRTWGLALDGAGVPNAPVRGLGEVANCAQTQALTILSPPRPGASAARVALPLTFDGVRPTVAPQAPELGSGSALLITAAGRDAP